MPGLWDFEGLWRLERRIDDRLGGVELRLTGEARFTRAGGGLDYVETGVLLRPGAPPMPARRAYRWQPGGAGIAVLFEDGRPFHDFDPTGAAAAAHWCDPDSYRVSYDFAAWPDWSSLWRVTGPRKMYAMQSRYRPA